MSAMMMSFLTHQLPWSRFITSYFQSSLSPQETNKVRVGTLMLPPPTSTNPNIIIPFFAFSVHNNIIRKCPFSHSERCFNNNDVCLIQSCVDCSGPMYIPRDVLHPWRERNHSWLELSQVHRETTNGVRVTVMPFFMGHREQQQGARVFFWRYNVRIESLEEVRVQLKERQWRVYSEAGTLETVNGKGVIGQVRRIDSARSNSGLQVLIIIAL